MTKKLSAIPKFWLTLDDCALLFKGFREKLAFNEPIPSFETRFPGKLESIINSVKQTYEGRYLNKTILDAAAAYFNQLVRGHAFQNGNKRIAFLFTHFFLLSHQVDFSLTSWEMYSFVVWLAMAGEKGISAEETKEWCRIIISEFTKKMEGVEFSE